MIAAIALGFFVIVNSAVGLRLIWTAAHKGGGAAWCCGLGFTSIGLIGYPMSTIAGVGSLPVGEVNHALGAAGTVFTALGLASFFAFTMLAFRANATWAWVFTGVCSTMLFVTSFGQIGALASAPPTLPSAVAVQSYGIVTGMLSFTCYAWSGVEGMQEWVRARRRVALGITDPLVANRIFLWGFHGCIVTSLNVLLMTMRFRSINLMESTAAQAAMTIFALVSCVTISLAFFPTKTWAAWVRSATQPAG